jgi:hypothetical protein
VISAKVEGADKLARGLAAAGSSLAGDVRQTMEAALLLVEGDARREAPQDTRRLSGSIVHEIHGQGAALTGTVGPSVRYGFYVHQGRRPGRMPPPRALEGWARRHGLNPYAVARSIARRGIPPNPFMARALARNRTRISQLFGRLGITVVSRVSGGH